MLSVINVYQDTAAMLTGQYKQRKHNMADTTTVGNGTIKNGSLCGLLKLLQKERRLVIGRTPIPLTTLTSNYPLLPRYQTFTGYKLTK